MTEFMSREEADKFGFEWPALNEARKVAGPRIQVTRTAHVRRPNGIYRFLTIKTERDELHIYVTPRGKTRIFRLGKKGSVELGPQDTR